LGEKDTFEQGLQNHRLKDGKPHLKEQSYTQEKRKTEQAVPGLKEIVKKGGTGSGEVMMETRLRWKLENT